MITLNGKKGSGMKLSNILFYFHEKVIPRQPLIKSSRLSLAIIFIIQAFIVLAVLAYQLHLTNVNLNIPLDYQGDTLFILMYIKGLIQNGWPTTITQLSAPFSYPGAAFPVQTSLDWLIMKGIAFYSTDPGFILNCFWLFSIVLTAWTAFYSYYQIGLSVSLSFISGIILAFIPFTFIRGEHHLNLVFFNVPLICLLSIGIANRWHGIRNVRQVIIVSLIACILIGFNRIYYSVFSIILVLLATLIAFNYKNGLKQFLIPTIAVSLIILSLAMNLIPSLMSWHQEGKPQNISYKTISEAEIYGAKLRKMVMPHIENPIPVLSKIAEKEKKAQFPMENENISVRMGLYGTLGLLIMFIFLLNFYNPQRLPFIKVTYLLGLGIFLTITTGGLGSLINLMSIPDIRAYNRFSVFLSFFAILSTGLFVKLIKLRSKPWRLFGHVVFSCFVLLSLYDQFLDSGYMIRNSQKRMNMVSEDKRNVQLAEHIMPKGSSVLQLPFVGFPFCYPINKMQSYDHIKPFIWSNTLKWSYATLAPKHIEWQKKIEQKKGEDLLKDAVCSGFDAIWIDRNAFPDSGRTILSELVIDGVHRHGDAHNHIAFLDIRKYKEKLISKMSSAERNKRISDLFDNYSFVWKYGYYDLESNQGMIPFMWVHRKAAFELRNVSKKNMKAIVSFTLSADEYGTIMMRYGTTTDTIKIGQQPLDITKMFLLSPGKNAIIKFQTTLNRVYTNHDTREKYYKISNFKIRSSFYSIN